MSSTLTDQGPVRSVRLAARAVEAVKVYGSGDASVRALDGVTVDFETLGEKDSALINTVTLRHRDSMKQERVPIIELRDRLLGDWDNHELGSS